MSHSAFPKPLSPQTRGTRNARGQKKNISTRSPGIATNPPFAPRTVGSAGEEPESPLTLSNRVDVLGNSGNSGGRGPSFGQVHICDYDICRAPDWMVRPTREDKKGLVIAVANAPNLFLLVSEHSPRTTFTFLMYGKKKTIKEKKNMMWLAPLVECGVCLMQVSS